MKIAPAYLILMLTDRCNLACQYCYLGQNTEAAETGTDMPDPIIDRALELWAGNRQKWRIQITGGEPFLAPKPLAYAARQIRNIAPGAKISVQTNATCLEDRALDLIQRYGLEVGVSLDGDPAIQDNTRGKAALTFKGLQRLDAAGIPFNVTCVVSSANADRLHRLVLTLGGFSMARGLGLDLLVSKGRAKETGIAPAPALVLTAGIRKLKTTLKLVNANRKIPMVVREQEKIRAARQGNRPSAFCHAAGGSSLLVTPKGDLYPCSQTAFDPGFYLGNLKEPVLAAQTVRQPCWPSLEQRAKNLCDHCPLHGCCPGECPSRLHYTDTLTPPLACTLYQALAENHS